MNQLTSLKIALIHDYLFEYGGAERVLEAIHEIWPKARLYTAFVDWAWVRKNKKSWLRWSIKESWFSRVPAHKQLCSPLRFLAPWIWENFDLRAYDLVISSSAWFICKGVIVHPGALHFCYCHTPPRYLYGYPESGRQNCLTRFYGRLVNPFMRRYDFLTSKRVDYFICNSRNVQQRIKKFYQREAKVIYPPVTITKPPLKTQKPKIDYYLMVNRLVGPKRVDLAIEACKKLALNLKIVGEGKAESALKALASSDPHIEFLGYLDDQQLAALYQNCRAVLYLAEEEDFGITPVEAMSFGKPVIALRSGGITESVVDGKTGFFIERPNLDELIEALKKFNLNFSKIKPAACLRQAQKFSKERFKKELVSFVASKIHQLEAK